MRDIVGDLKKKQEEEARVLQSYQQAADLAKQIKETRKQQNDIASQISAYMNQDLPKAGTLKRIGAFMSPLLPTDAIYRANAASFKPDATTTTFLKTFATSYAKTVRDSVMTAATGRDFLKDQKLYGDIARDQMGIKNKYVAGAVGIAGDMATDPSNFINMPAKLMTYGGKSLAGLAKNSKTIEKGFDAIRTRFDLFYQIGKNSKPEEVAQFKDAFRDAVESGSFAKLKLMGFDLRKYGIGKGTDPSTMSNYKSLAARTIVNNTPEMVKAEKELTRLEAALSKAKVDQKDFILKKHDKSYYEKIANEINDELWWSYKHGSSGSGNVNVLQAAKNSKRGAWAERDIGTAFNLNVQNLEKALAKKQAEVLNLKKANTITEDYSEYYKILDQAFGPKKEPGLIGKGFDMGANVFKSAMAWSPRFQTRNTMGALTQFLTDSSLNTKNLFGLKDLVGAGKLLATKGASDPVTYDALRRSGQLSQVGMFNTATNWFTKIPHMFSNLSESIFRTAKALNAKGQGKSLVEAIEETQKMYYKYNDAYLTSFEQGLQRYVMPFYSFTKGNLAYQPGSLGRNEMKWRGLIRTKQETEPEDSKAYPFLSPEWFKSQFSVGSVGNFGFQMEDFMKNVTLDYKNMYAQMHPFLKGAAESAAGYDVFREKKIDNWGQWGTNLMFGPVAQSIKYGKEAWEGEGSWARPFTSVRDYDLSAGALHRMDLMDTREKTRNGGYWSNLKDRLLGILGSSASETSLYQASATGTKGPAPVKIEAVSPVAQTELAQANAKNMALDQFFAKRKLDPNMFGQQYVSGAPNEQILLFNSMQRNLSDLAKLAPFLTKDLQAGAAAATGFELQRLEAQKTYMHGVPYSQHLIAGLSLQQEMEKQKLTGPYADRKLSERPLWGPQDLIYRKSFGIDAPGRAYNMVLDEAMKFASKLSEMRRASDDKSSASVWRTWAADRQYAKMQYTRGFGGISADQYEQYLLAADDKRDAGLAEIRAKLSKAWGEVYKNLADATSDSLQKVDWERQAELTTMRSTDAWKQAEAEKRDELLKAIEDSVNAKFDLKRNEAIAKLAKDHMERIKEMATSEAKATLDALQQIYERGGLTIDQYFDKVIQKTQSKYDQISKGLLGLAKSLITAGKPKADTTDNDNIWSIAEKALINLQDPTLDPEKASALIEEIIKILSGFLDGLNIEALRNALSELYKAAQHAKDDLGDIPNQRADQERIFSEAVTSLRNQANQIMLASAAMQNPSQPESGGLAGVLSRTFGAGRDIPLPAKPYNFDYMEERHKQEREDQFQDQAASYSKAIATSKLYALPGWGLGEYTGTTSEEAADYITRFEEEKAAYKAMLDENLINRETYNAQVEALELKVDTNQQKRNQLLVKQDMEIWEKRLNNAQQVTGGLLQLTTMLYEASGKQSKEAFYAMKAMAMADAIVNGAVAVVKAWSTGGPYLGPVLAGITAAMVGVQIGIIAAQTAQGPEGKAEGGIIEGGSGTKDDVPIMAMGGEYVIRKSSVDKYGKGMLESINQGLFDAGNVSFQMPDIPTRRRDHFADGGMIPEIEKSKEANATPSNLQIVNVVEPAILDKFLATPNGERRILNVLSANKYEITRILSE